MKKWLLAVIVAWVCSSSFVLADELPATVRFLNVMPSDVAPSVEVEGFPKVELVMGRAVGPVGLRPGDYQIMFKLAEKKHKRAAKLEAGRGKLFIVSPKSGDASEMHVMEFEAIHPDDLAGAGEGRSVRMINLTAGDLEVKTNEDEHQLKPGGEHMLATKQSQLALAVGDDVVAAVDLRDLSACSVVFYLNAQSKLESLILPEPIDSLENDGQ